MSENNFKIKKSVRFSSFSRTKIKRGVKKKQINENDITTDVEL